MTRPRVPARPRARREPAVLLCAALAAAAFAAKAWAATAPEALTWTRYRSPNFTVLSSAPARRTTDIIVRLERFREVLDTIFPNLQVASPVDTTVFVFRDGAALQPFAPRYNGKPIEVDGVFYRTRAANFVVVDASAADPMTVVYHEYMHYFTNRNLPPLPLWFSEGIAECYETFRTDGRTAELGRVKTNHVLFLREATFMPLEQLLAVGHDSPDYNEGDRRGVFYAESWALVHYLLWDSGAHRAHVVDYLERLGQGQSPKEAFPAAFGMAPGALEAELRRNLQGNRYLKSVVTLKSKPPEAAITKTPAGRPQILAAFGDFLARAEAERTEDAERYLSQALAAEPNDPVALRALALVRKNQGRSGEALPLLEKALAADPRDGMTEWALGELLLETQDDAAPRARALLLAAITHRPDIPEIAGVYGSALLRGAPEPTPDEVNRAIAMLNDAREKLPWRPDVLATQALLLAAGGNLPAAESLVERALPKLGDPGMVTWAREALEYYRREVQARAEADREARAEAGREAQAQAEAGREAEEASAAAETAAQERPPHPVHPTELGVTSPQLIDGPTADQEEAAKRSQAYNRDVATFNRAIEMANRRDYAGAVALLEKLAASTPFDDIRGRIRPLLKDLKARAARK